MVNDHETFQSVVMDQSMFKCLEDRYGVMVRIFSQALAGFSGDFWGSFKISQYEFGLYIADLCGHGAAAARNASCLQGIVEECAHLAAFPDKYMAELNIRLEKKLQVHEYATMFYGIVNIKDNTLRYSTAANPPVLWLHEGGKVQLLKQGSGVPLGIDAHAVYDVHTVPYFAGDALFMYSDALIETQNRHGEYLSDDGLKSLLRNLLQALEGSTSSQRFSMLFNQVVEIIQQDYVPQVHDDLTMVMVARDAIITPR
jgi:phosphoserine phosphatase RsbU/P